MIFRNWKKIEWHLIFQKSSGDRQGVSRLRQASHRKIIQSSALRLRLCHFKISSDTPAYSCQMIMIDYPNWLLSKSICSFFLLSNFSFFAISRCFCHICLRKSCWNANFNLDTVWDGDISMLRINRTTIAESFFKFFSLVYTANISIEKKCNFLIRLVYSTIVCILK